MSEIAGASLAVLVDTPDGNQDILVYRRDNNPAIPYYNKLDLPGGGIEFNEDVFGCATRETWEELHVLVRKQQIGWLALYPRANGVDKNAFLVAHVTPADIISMHIGDEGANCQQMPVTEYLGHPDAIVDHQDRLRDYFNRATDIGEIILLGTTAEAQPSNLTFA